MKKNGKRIFTKFACKNFSCLKDKEAMRYTSLSGDKEGEISLKVSNKSSSKYTLLAITFN